jgi:magnesium transporter
VCALSWLEKAVVLTLFIPLIMSSGGNSGSQATSLIIRAVALQEVRLRDWWRVALRELPTGVMLGSILGAIGIIRITLWQKLGVFDYGEHWILVACTVGAACRRGGQMESTGCCGSPVISRRSEIARTSAFVFGSST